MSVLLSPNGSSSDLSWINVSKKLSSKNLPQKRGSCARNKPEVVSPTWHKTCHNQSAGVAEARVAEATDGTMRAGQEGSFGGRKGSTDALRFRATNPGVLTHNARLQPRVGQSVGQHEHEPGRWKGALRRRSGREIVSMGLWSA